MLKAVLIALAALTLFDAVAWQGSCRSQLGRQIGIALQEAEELNW